MAPGETWEIRASGALVQTLKDLQSLAKLRNFDPTQVVLRQAPALFARLDRLVDELLTDVGGDGIEDGAGRGRDPESFEPGEVSIWEGTEVDLDPGRGRPSGSVADVHGHMHFAWIDVAQMVEVQRRVMGQGRGCVEPKKRFLVLRQRIAGQLRDLVDREADARDDTFMRQSTQRVLGRPDRARVVRRQQPMLIDCALKELWKELCRHGNTVPYGTRFCQVYVGT